MRNRFTASLLAAMALAAVPAGVAPVAQADVCGDVGGRHVNVGGCSNIGGDIADAAVIGAAVDRPYGYGYGYPPPPPEGWPPLPPGYLPFPSFPGEAPCYLPSGQPYYTPGTMPCY
ncbi:MAG: hypothetical protein FGM50_11865 [Mycobacterium sp.]|nr:hypothetical protein [Mycobacterium sp.]